MTKEEFKIKLAEHNFKSYDEFLDMVEDIQKMSPEIKYTLLREEWNAETQQQ